MNNKYLVIATLSGGDFDENEVWTNQWKVGTFEQLGMCYLESELDMKQTLRDSFEYQFEDDEEDEENSLEQHVELIFQDREKCHRLEKELDLFEPNIILSIQYEVNEYNTVEVNYLVIRLN